MLKKIWNKLGDLRLTFWLLLAAAVLFFAGSFYANNNFSYTTTLNRMPVQEWLSRNASGNWHLSWWIPVLFVVMGLLGINTFICSYNRIASLLPLRHQLTFRRFFLKMTPSLIHCLFMAVMLGHLVTFTFGRWESIPLRKGKTVEFTRSVPDLKVDSMDVVFFSKDTSLSNRISQMSVQMSSSEGEKVKISYLEPVSYHGYHLIPEKKKKKKKCCEGGEKKAEPEIEIKNCNTSIIYHVAKKSDKKGKEGFILLAVYDPGLYIIIIAFFLILVLMLWYYVEIYLLNNKSKC